MGILKKMNFVLFFLSLSLPVLAVPTGNSLSRRKRIASSYLFPVALNIYPDETSLLRLITGIENSNLNINNSGYLAYVSRRDRIRIQGPKRTRLTRRKRRKLQRRPRMS